MKIKCSNCLKEFNRKPSELSKLNFCSRNCCSIYKKSNNLDHKRIMKFFKLSWTNMNIRAGKYRHLQTINKCITYQNINVKIERNEFKAWCFENNKDILIMNRPSIDRIDSSKDYTLDNIRIIELEENIQLKRIGNSYLNGPLKYNYRGVRKTKSGKFSARISINNKEIHLGVFETEEQAYNIFRNYYIKHYGFEPFNEV